MERSGQAVAARQMDALFRSGTAAGLSDAELLGRFATRRDEAAFGALVMRHGPMVLRVCRSVLRDAHEADDAFQATFLVLVRRAGSLRVRDSLGPWLHQTAYRTASRVRSAAARRKRHESRAAERTARFIGEPGRDEFEGVIHEEVDRLPQKYRAAVVLCLMEGRTPEQAARSLGCPVGTVHSRLARGRARLRSRLTGRGVTIPAGLLAASVSRSATAAIAPALADAAVRAAMRAGGNPGVTVGITSVRAAMRAGGNPGVTVGITSFLVDFIIKRTTRNALRVAAAVVLSVGLVTTGGALAPPQAPPAEEGKTKIEKAATAPDDRPKPAAASRDSILAVAFAPDGKTVAASSQDKTVTLWDTTTGNVRTNMETPDDATVLALAFSADGATLVGVRNDGQANLWNARTGKSEGEMDALGDTMRQSVAPSGGGSAVAFSPDGRRLALGGDSTSLGLKTRAYQIRVFEWPVTGVLWEHIGRGDLVGALAFSPDSKILAHAGLIQGKVGLWDVETGEPKRTLEPDKRGVASSFSSDGKLIAAGGGGFVKGEATLEPEGRVTIWDAATGERWRQVDGPPGGVTALAFVPGRHEIACGGVGRSEDANGGRRTHGEVRLWDVDSGALRWTWKGPDGGGRESPGGLA